MGGVVAGRWVSDEGGEQVGEMQGESGQEEVCRGQVADRQAAAPSFWCSSFFATLRHEAHRKDRQCCLITGFFLALSTHLRMCGESHAVGAHGQAQVFTLVDGE